MSVKQTTRLQRIIPKNFDIAVEPINKEEYGAGEGQAWINNQRYWKHFLPTTCVGLPSIDKKRGKVGVVIAAKPLFPWLQSMLKKQFSLVFDGWSQKAELCPRFVFHPCTISEQSKAFLCYLPRFIWILW